MSDLCSLAWRDISSCNSWSTQTFLLYIIVIGNHVFQGGGIVVYFWHSINFRGWTDTSAGQYFVLKLVFFIFYFFSCISQLSRNTKHKSGGIISKIRLQEYAPKNHRQISWIGLTDIKIIGLKNTFILQSLITFTFILEVTWPWDMFLEMLCRNRIQK